MADMTVKKKTKKPRKRALAPFPVIIYTIIVIWCVIFLGMFLWGVIQSFKDTTNFYYDKVGFPSAEYGWQFSNYSLVFKEVRILVNGRNVYLPEMLYNTMFYCIVYGLVSVIAPMMTSYVYAKYNKRVPWVKVVWVIVLINLYVPLSASLGASLRLAMRMGYYNNLYLLIFAMTSGFNGNFLIYFATWKGLSWEFAEAAMIDGANPWKIFFKVMFPLTGNIFVVLLVTQIIAYWSDYQTPMVFLPAHPTLAYGVYMFQQSISNGANFPPVQIAALITVAIPILALFLIFRKQMMSSLTVGGLKG